MEHDKGEFVECARTVEQKKNRKEFNIREIISEAVELPIFLTMFAISMQGPPISNLMLYRTCVHSLNQTVGDCQSFLSTSSIDHSAELENEVQKYATNVKTVESLIKAVGPAVLTLFMGVWSDKHGRKPLLLWPQFGMTISAIIMLLYSMLGSLGPWWIIVPAVPFSLFGGFHVMLTGALCFNSDVSSEKNRSLRLLVLVMTITVAVSVGGMVSPYLMRAIGIIWFLALMSIFFIVSFVFILFCLKESLLEAVKGSILTIFDCSHPKEMFRCCFMKKPNNVRAIVLLTVATSSLYIFTEYGVNNLTYMYTRTKLQWSMTKFTTFSAVCAAWAFTGSLLGIALLQRLLKISDLNFICVSFLLTIVEYIIKGLATTTWHMYIAAAISLFGTISGPLLRSFLTKCVARTDTAKVFSLLGFAESFFPLLSSPVYNALYTLTIDIFPGAIMFLTAVINLMCLALTLIVKRLKSQDDSRQEVKLEAKS